MSGILSGYERPPIGVTPKFLWEEARIHELFEAMMRYRQAGKQFPEEWIEEFNELIKKEY